MRLGRNSRRMFGFSRVETGPRPAIGAQCVGFTSREILLTLNLTMCGEEYSCMCVGNVFVICIRMDAIAHVELLLWLTMDVYVNAQFGKSKSACFSRDFLKIEKSVC